MICLDDSLKENVELVEINEDILKIEKPDGDQDLKKEESRGAFPYKLLNVIEYRTVSIAILRFLKNFIYQLIYQFNY